MSITISADDPRTIRAVEIAAEAGKWRRWYSPEGQQVFGVPSQSHSGHTYRVTLNTCDCPDFLRGGEQPLVDNAADDPRACKHILAVRLYCELVRGQRDRSAPAADPRRAHLRLVR
jgi:hypothetical protein